MPLGTSLNPNRAHSIGVFLFFVPKMCPKCDSFGATFFINSFSIHLKTEVLRGNELEGRSHNTAVIYFRFNMDW